MGKDKVKGGKQQQKPQKKDNTKGNTKDKKSKGSIDKKAKKPKTKGRQLFANKNLINKKNQNAKAKKDSNNKNQNDKAKVKPLPKKDSSNKNQNDKAKPNELDALKKECQKNALCRKLMECKMKAQKAKPTKPTKPADACKEELAACKKDPVCAALHKGLAEATAAGKKGKEGKPQDKKK